VLASWQPGNRDIKRKESGMSKEEGIKGTLSVTYSLLLGPTS
jgi:hypothetical protein